MALGVRLATNEIFSMLGIVLGTLVIILIFITSGEEFREWPIQLFVGAIFVGNYWFLINVIRNSSKFSKTISPLEDFEKFVFTVTERMLTLLRRGGLNEEECVDFVREYLGGSGPNEQKK